MQTAADHKQKPEFTGGEYMLEARPRRLEERIQEMHPDLPVGQGACDLPAHKCPSSPIGCSYILRSRPAWPQHTVVVPNKGSEHPGQNEPLGLNAHPCVCICGQHFGAP
eukprot:1139751-Pelagomonas_calceolata.AAC.3